MDFLITWVLIGLVSAIIAARKGHSGCGWFVLGILFGPFSLVFALLVPRNPALSARMTLQGKARRTCPHCAEQIRSEAVRCSYCGEYAARGGKKQSIIGARASEIMAVIRHRIIETDTGAYLIYLVILVIIIVYLVSP